MSAAAFRESRFPVGSSHSTRLGWFTSAPRYRHPLALSAGQRGGQRVEPVPQPDRVERPDGRPEPCASRRLVVKLGEQYVL
jgi:hypothetical protein